MRQFAAAAQETLHDELVSGAFMCSAAGIPACHTQTDGISAAGLLFVCDSQLETAVRHAFLWEIRVSRVRIYCGAQSKIWQK
jgi:hypothetical protein